MAYIFLDESGDLGFKKSNSSNYFIVTFLFVESKRAIEKVVSLTHKSLKKIYCFHKITKPYTLFTSNHSGGPRIRKLLVSMIITNIY